MSAEKDVYGNEIKFEYFQVNEALCSGRWEQFPSVNKSYTKASYLSSITNQQGGKVEFIHDIDVGQGGIAKDEREVYDYNTLRPEPDGFMEFYESLLLDSISVFAPSGTKICSYKLKYNKINEEISGSYLKSLLISISEYGLNDNKLCNRNYTYNRQFDKVDEDPDYNYGAMSQRITNNGGRVKYSYSRRKLENIQETIAKESRYVFNGTL